MVDEKADERVIEPQILLPEELGSSQISKTVVNLLELAYEYRQSKEFNRAFLAVAQASVGHAVKEAYLDCIVVPKHTGKADQEQMNVRFSPRLVLEDDVSISEDLIEKAVKLLQGDSKSPLSISFDRDIETLQVETENGLAIEFNAGKALRKNNHEENQTNRKHISGLVSYDRKERAVHITIGESNADGSVNANNINRVAGTVPQLLAITAQLGNALNRAMGGVEQHVIGWNNPIGGGAFSYDDEGNIYTVNGKRVGYVK